jgi:hypothetical protein
MKMESDVSLSAIIALVLFAVVCAVYVDQNYTTCVMSDGDVQMCPRQD